MPSSVTVCTYTLTFNSPTGQCYDYVREGNMHVKYGTGGEMRKHMEFQLENVWEEATWKN
jgi:hypothetical protein